MNFNSFKNAMLKINVKGHHVGELSWIKLHK